jgi:phosphoglycerol transferase MdoB-like AlkP superfamily enzyme
MKLAINLKSLEWWFWGITLAAMIVGLAGRVEGFYIVIAVSVVQFFYFVLRQGFAAFPTQVRFVYGIFTIMALFDPTRIFYWALLVGTVMVTLFNRCIIARVLLLMPWNKDVQLS